jgi:Mn2+/Fe2+ NRAMP family transporter
VKKLLEISLGIMTAVGGFVEVSELTFAAQAGAKFAYSLIWVFVISTIGMIVFGEMAGRVAAAARQPVFNLMRQRLGLGLGLVTLIASVVVNLVTCGAEIGGVALVLHLLTGWPYMPLAAASAFVFAAIVWVIPFKWIERIFGLLGLTMLVFAAAVFALHPPWDEVAKGAIPNIPPNLSGHDLLVYGYFAVAIVSAVLFPYELYFYSSGAIEEHWTAKDIGVNRLTTVVGFSLGSLLAISLLVNAAVLFQPLMVGPQQPGTVAMQALPFGAKGVLLALLGMLFAIGGAAIETGLSVAYGVAQFFGWEWGRYEKPWDAPRFTLVWLAAFAGALALVLTGIKPLDLVEWAVILSVVVLPLTYLPLLLIAGDRKYMNAHLNGRLSNTLGWIFYAMLCLAAVAALPLFFLTGGGQG